MDSLEKLVILSDPASMPLARNIHQLLEKKIKLEMPAIPSFEASNVQDICSSSPANLSPEICALFGAMNRNVAGLKDYVDKRITAALPQFDENALYINTFPNGEVDVDPRTNLRHKNVFLIKSLSHYVRKWNDGVSNCEIGYGVNNAIQELKIINHTIYNASADSITAIAFFIPYLRQDRKDRPRRPISAKVMVGDLESFGVDRVVTLEPHFQQLQGFFENAKVDVLNADVLFADYFINKTKANNDLNNHVVVSTDLGGRKRGRDLANKLGIPYITCDKQRQKSGQVEKMDIMKPGDFCLEGKDMIIYDDMVDTGGTVFASEKRLRQENVGRIYVCCAHPVLSGDAKKMLADMQLPLITTDSIMVDDIDKYPNIEVVSLKYYGAEAIYAIAGQGHDPSVSRNLFNLKNYQELKKKLDSV